MRKLLTLTALVLTAAQAHANEVTPEALRKATATPHAAVTQPSQQAPLSAPAELANTSAQAKTAQTTSKPTKSSAQKQEKSSPPSFLSGTSDRVVAVVNATPITRQDLDSRYQLTLRQLEKNIPASQQKALYLRTLTLLIDESIQRQYAEKNKLKLAPGEYENAIHFIEQKNDMKPGEFKKLTHGLEASAKDQIEAQILWQKIIESRIKPRIYISNDEVDALINAMKGAQAVGEKQVAQIFIAATEGKTATSAEETAQNLYKRLTETKDADFATLAKAFSEDPSAANGGTLGWFAAGEMAPQLNEALKNMHQGGISKPIQTAAGWHILTVTAERKAKQLTTEPVQEYHLVKVRLTPENSLESEQESNKKQKELLKKLEAAPSVTEAKLLVQELKQEPETAQSADLGWAAAESLPTSLTPLIAPLKEGEHTAFLEASDGTSVAYLLAEKRLRLPQELLSLRNRIKERLFANQLELNTRRLLRDLRRQAYVDVKL